MNNTVDMLTGVQHVGISSKNLLDTKIFYTSLGFKKVGYFPFDGGKNHSLFLQLGNLVIETWKENDDFQNVGAINHISLNTEDIQDVYSKVKSMNFKVIEEKIQFIPTFWKFGILYFNILGPNNEKIEICQILKKGIKDIYEKR